MRGERHRHPRAERLPRRPTDRVEDAVAWLLTAVGLLVVVLALSAGARSYGEARHRIDVQARERTQVQAVLLDAARPGVPAQARGRGTRPVAARVPVRYTAPDGSVRVTDARMPEARPAGATTPIWVDRYGATTAAPGRPATAVGDAMGGVIGVLVINACLVGVIWVGVRAGTSRANALRWEREWAQVEPRWSGRTHS